MKRHVKSLIAGMAIAALAGCPGQATQKVPEPTPQPPTPVATGGEPATPAEPAPPAGPPKKVVNMSLAEVGIDGSGLDRNANPCEDFYQFACGGWMAKTEIPADKSRFGRFNEINDRNEATLKQILESAAKADRKKEPRLARLGDYYAACMDEAGIEKAGLKPVKPLLDKVAKVKDEKSLRAAVVELHGIGFGALFFSWADQDAKETTRVVALLNQGGLGMPDRDYYLTDEEPTKTLRGKYTEHVERFFLLAGDKPEAAKKAAADVLEVETALAKVSITRVQQRDNELTYNKVARAELNTKAPGFDWNAYLDAMGIKDQSDVILQSPAYFAGVGELVKTVPMDKWRNYLRGVVLRNASGDLGKAFVDEEFAWRQALTGQKEIEPRWKRCVRETEGGLGEDLGQEFIAVAFPGDSKQIALDMVNAVLVAFRQELPELDWMDAETRARANEKLDTFRPHIGYPNKFKAYDFKVARGSHFANDMAASRWGVKWVFSRIGKPVDREEWQMFPQTVNAYYNATKNEIVFPAGILQSPFFAARAALAVNLGGIGMVIGHEISHGFDDEGSRFAPDGNLKEWWTAASRKKFDERTACVEQQYAKYEPIPGVKLNGKLTLGENIADLGGVIVAHRAWRNLRGDAPETINADGFSEEQLFFLNVGQIWCNKSRDEATRQLAKTDSHSPPQFRVNGPLANTPAFHKAFGCKVGQKMRPVDDGKMCRVW